LLLDVVLFRPDVAQAVLQGADLAEPLAFARLVAPAETSYRFTYKLTPTCRAV